MHLLRQGSGGRTLDGRWMVVWRADTSAIRGHMACHMQCLMPNIKISNMDMDPIANFILSFIELTKVLNAMAGRFFVLLLLGRWPLPQRDRLYDMREAI